MHGLVVETTASYNYCPWPQEVVRPMTWTSFGCMQESWRGKGTSRDGRDGGHEGEVVVRGKQGEGDDSCRGCCTSLERVRRSNARAGTWGVCTLHAKNVW